MLSACYQIRFARVSGHRRCLQDLPVDVDQTAPRRAQTLPHPQLELDRCGPAKTVGNIWNEGEIDPETFSLYSHHRQRGGEPSAVVIARIVVAPTATPALTLTADTRQCSGRHSYRPYWLLWRSLLRKDAAISA